MNKRVVMSLILVLTIGFGTLLLVSDKVGGAATVTLTAAFLEKAPIGFDDPVWEKAKSKSKYCGKR